VSERTQENSQGKFIRPSTTFRHQITADGSSGFKAEPGRYHLYISWSFPWACRTAIIRQLKGLQNVIGLSVVGAEIDQNSWEFTTEPGCFPDTVNGAQYLWQIYL
jgi:putative glutathione S-transferase